MCLLKHRNVLMNVSKLWFESIKRAIEFGKIKVFKMIILLANNKYFSHKIKNNSHHEKKFQQSNGFIIY